MKLDTWAYKVAEIKDPKNKRGITLAIRFTLLGKIFLYLWELKDFFEDLYVNIQIKVGRRRK